MPGKLPSPAQHVTATLARQFPSPEGHLAVDDDVDHAVSSAIWLGRRAALAEDLRIEDGQIGTGPLADYPSIGKPEPARRKPKNLPSWLVVDSPGAPMVAGGVFRDQSSISSARVLTSVR